MRKRLKAASSGDGATSRQRPRLPHEQAALAYALAADGQYELTGTYAEPGPMHARTRPELPIGWADIFGPLPALVGWV